MKIHVGFYNLDKWNYVCQFDKSKLFLIYSLSAYGGRGHIDPEELFRNIFGDNFNFKNFQESDDYESTQYGFAQASEVCKSYRLCICICNN